MNWMKVVIVTHLSVHRQDLQFFVQIIQALIFYLAHCFILQVRNDYGGYIRNSNIRDPGLLVVRLGVGLASS